MNADQVMTGVGEADLAHRIASGITVGIPGTEAVKKVVELAKLYGFHLLHTCTNFMESMPPSRDHPRVQYVMEKPRLMM